MRRLIVNADDFGISRGVNLGIIEAYRRGIVTSTSVLVHAPCTSDLLDFSRDIQGLDLGLHVDLGEWVYCEGAWTSHYEVVPLDNRKAVLLELDRQLDDFRRLTGQAPTHIDSHQHVHCDDQIRDLVIAWVGRLSIPLRHFSADIVFCGRFYGQTGTGESLPDLITVPALQDVLSSLAGGITELTCHPALFVDFESTYRHERVRELETLCDPRIVAAVDSLGIELCSFRDLNRDAHEGGSTSPSVLCERLRS